MISGGSISSIEVSRFQSFKVSKTKGFKVSEVSRFQGTAQKAKRRNSSGKGSLTMGNHSLPQAKGYIAGALRKAVDPDPSTRQLKALRAHFESRCAYCGRDLDPDDRTSHLDHLRSGGRGGRNHISNRVLSCNHCNGDHKREGDWEKFLAKVCGLGTGLYAARHQRILDWQKACGNPPDIGEAIAAERDRSIEICRSTLEKHHRRLRSLLKAQRSD